MRLSEWSDVAPRQNAMTPKVMATISSALDLLGAGPDPDCWVAWGGDPVSATSFAVTTRASQDQRRVNVPGEGPRASGSLVRWNRLQIGELGVEIQGGHRLLNFQLEGVLLPRPGRHGRRRRRLRPGRLHRHGQDRRPPNGPTRPRRAAVRRRSELPPPNPT